MKAHQDQVSGLFLLFVSIIACFSAYGMGLGSMSNPGPGTISFGIGVLMGVLSLILFLKPLLTSRKATAQAPEPGPRLSLRPFLTLAVLVAYGIAFNRIGFVASTFLVMMALMWGVGRQKLMFSLFISIVAAGAAYLLFVVILGLPFPPGTLWSFLEG